VPDIELYPGETVTVYVTVKIGNMMYYYALTITRPADLRPIIRRSETLPTIAGATTNPPAGVHYVNSGSDFVFTLTLTGAGLRSSAPPVIRTGRDNMPDDVVVTSNADGTYTVCIREIRSAITLSIDLSTGNTDVDGDRIWSSGHTLYIYATHDGEARIYGLTGQLVKALPYTAGETAQTTLPQGVYIVVADGRTHKVRIEN
jgi:hypothetical protein